LVDDLPEQGAEGGTDTKEEELIGGRWRKLCNEEVRDVCTSPNIMRVI